VHGFIFGDESRRAQGLANKTGDAVEISFHTGSPSMKSFRIEGVFFVRNLFSFYKSGEETKRKHRRPRLFFVRFVWSHCNAKKEDEKGEKI